MALQCPGKTEIAQRGAGKQEETQSSEAFHMQVNKQEERLMLLKKIESEDRCWDPRQDLRLWEMMRLE